jgi:hypothetical protein
MQTVMAIKRAPRRSGNWLKMDVGGKGRLRNLLAQSVSGKGALSQLVARS